MSYMERFFVIHRTKNVFNIPKINLEVFLLDNYLIKHNTFLVALGGPLPSVVQCYTRIEVYSYTLVVLQYCPLRGVEGA